MTKLTTLCSNPVAGCVYVRLALQAGCCLKEFENEIALTAPCLGPAGHAEAKVHIGVSQN